MTYYTKDEFKQFLYKQCLHLTKLRSEANDLLIKANNHYLIHQTKWMDEPCLQLPQDLMIIQEIIYKTKPQFIIETGTGWGGLTLFCSTLADAWGGHVISIDINMKQDLTERLFKKPTRPTLINGSSTDPKTIKMIEHIVNHHPSMVILDSNHTHEHVLQELKLYSQFTKPGMYIVVCDTIIEDIPNDRVDRKRPWGPGNNPHTALQEFLNSGHKYYEIHDHISNKYLFSLNTYIYDNDNSSYLET